MAGLRIELQSEAIGEPGEVVEDADDVRDFEDRFVIKPEVAERLPVFFDHSRRIAAELVGDGAESAVAR